jgi:hypothetical protein
VRQLPAATVRHIHDLIRNVLGDAEREELVHRLPSRPPSTAHRGADLAFLGKVEHPTSERP